LLEYYISTKEKLTADKQKQLILLYGLAMLLEQIGAGFNSQTSLTSGLQFTSLCSVNCLLIKGDI